MKFPVLLLTSLCLASSAHALQIGESLSPALMTQLGIAPDRITVIDFFASWCASCRKELPLISAAHRKSDARQIEFLGVDTDENVADGEAFQKALSSQNALSFRVLNDPKQQLVQSFRPKGYPALYILKGGKVERMYLGAVPEVDALLERDLKALGGRP